MTLEKLITLTIFLALLTILSVVYREIFGVKVKKIILTIIWTCGIWSILLITYKYFPDSIIPSIILLWTITWFIKQEQRGSIFLLTGILWLVYYFSYTWINNIFILLLSVVCIEEIAKSTWIILHNKNILPNDAILWWLLLWSFFWVFEAGRAGRIDTISQIRMRVSSTISIHTITTATILWMWAYSLGESKIRKNLNILLWVIWALLIHSGYNYFQWNILLLLSIIIGSYVILTYRVSKVDRVII